MKPSAGSSILLMLMGSVGDVARGLALVHQLKAQIPEVRITWLVEPKSAQLVTLHPGIDEVIFFQRNKGISAIWALRKQLRQRHFDIVLDLQRHFKSGFFSRLSGAKRIVGFHRCDGKEGNFLFATETIPERGETGSKLDHYLTFIEKLELSILRPIDFGIRSEALKQSVPEKISALDTHAVGIVLGSAWKSKNWVDEGYDQLIAMLLQQTSSTIVLLGDLSSVDLAQRLIAAHQSERLVSVAGETSLAQLTGLLARLSVVCGPDSGPGHIAAAVGTPYVALFGATDPQRTAPFESEDLVIRSAIGCSPCYRRECPGLNRLCMRLIAPHAVFERLTAVLAPK